MYDPALPKADAKILAQPFYLNDAHARQIGGPSPKD
jgi:hypothetical protein